MRFWREAWKKLRRKCGKSPPLLKKAWYQNVNSLSAWQHSTQQPLLLKNKTRAPRSRTYSPHHCRPAASQRRAALETLQRATDLAPLSRCRRGTTSLFWDVTCHTMLSHVTNDVFTVAVCGCFCLSQARSPFIDHCSCCHRPKH